MKAPAISSVTPGSVALNGLERVKGIEPSYAAWEAAVLPLNYTRAIAAMRWSESLT